MGLYLGSNKLNVNLCNDKLLAKYYVSEESQEKTVNLPTLKINKLTQEQYDEELANGNIDDTALYLTPDDRKSVYQYAKEYGYTGTEEEFEEFFLNLSTINEDVFLKLAIKPTTEKAVCHNIQDSTDYRILDFNMDGKTEQFTTTGKNIFDLSKLSKNDLIIAKNDTGFNLKNCFGNIVMHNEAVMSIFEPSTSYICTLKCKVINIPDSTNLNAQNSILLFYNSVSTKSCGFVNAVDKNNWTVGQTYEITKSFTTPDDLNGFNVVGYTYRDNDTATHSGEFEITEIMVRKATVTDATYEPYTGGVASPNPNYPQDIKNAGVYNEKTGRYEVTFDIVNKNLLPYPYAESTITRHGVTFTDNGDRSITAQGTAEKATYFVLNKGFEFKKDINAMNKESGTNGEYAINRDMYYNSVNKVVSINIQKDATVNTTYYPQLEYGTVATPYIQHQKQSITLSSDRPLTKWDKLEKRNDVYGWVCKGKKYVFNGSMWLTYGNFNGFTLPNCLNEKSNRREGYCNQAKVVTSKENLTPSNGLWIGVSNNTALYLVNNSFYDDSLEDKGLANFKAHLNENPLEIWTYTDTEEFVPLLDEEQELLKNLETYYGVTNIMNDQDCITQIMYVADTKIYIDNEFNALQTAIVGLDDTI